MSQFCQRPRSACLQLFEQAITRVVVSNLISPVAVMLGRAYLAGARGGAKSMELTENGVFEGAGALSCFLPHWQPFAAHLQHPPQHDIF